MDDYIMKLDQLLKFTGVAGTGGQAKMLIQSGSVVVNGEVETRRGRKLREGDEVIVGEQVFTIGPPEDEDDMDPEDLDDMDPEDP